MYAVHVFADDINCVAADGLEFIALFSRLTVGDTVHDPVFFMDHDCRSHRIIDE